MLETGNNSLVNSLGIEFLSIDYKQLSARMPVDNRTRQPFGILHGGASVALAETLCSIGGWLNVDDKKFYVVGQEINANHIRPVKSGDVIGTAIPIHLGRRSQVWQTEIREQSDKLVCISRCTLSVLEIKS